MWYDSHIIKIEDAGTGTKRFWVETEGENPFDFKAGQFVVMDLPISDKRLKRWRSYSIANPPDGGRVLEFCISRYEPGAGTRFFFEEAGVGTAIRFKGPEGGFYLREPIEKDLVFICTGTGIAPFRSMIQDLRNRQTPHKNLHLIFGTRTETGILYGQEMEALAGELPGFRYDVALSRQPEWPGFRGYVHQIYEAAYATARPDILFYICGWSAMVDDAVAKLIVEMGYDRSQVIYELYG